MEARKAARAHTLESFLDERYRSWAEVHLRQPKEWLRKIESYLPEFGTKKLPEMTAWLIEKHRSARLKQGVKPATTNRELTAIKAVLQKAVHGELLETNPLSGVKPMREDRLAKVRYLLPDQETRLREALDAGEPSPISREANRERRQPIFSLLRIQ